MKTVIHNPTDSVYVPVGDYVHAAGVEGSGVKRVERVAFRIDGSLILAA